MLKNKSKATRIFTPEKQTRGCGGGGGGGGAEAAAGWEVRPGGMLVQKRNSDQNSLPIPKIKVSVKYGLACHEISISPQASFGELKNMLAGLTGLHPLDHKLMYKGKERDSKSFLDIDGVSNGSRMELIEDVMRREKRVLESRTYEKIDKASKAISEIGLEVNKLAKQVAILDAEIYGGKKVEETVLLKLIEFLMTQLLKLDEIVGDGEVKLQRREQVRRVQKYIETLDMLKIKNAENEVKTPFQHKQKKHSAEQMPKPIQNQLEQRKQRNLTTKWEAFDSNVAAPPRFTSSSTDNNFHLLIGSSHFQFQ